MPSLFGRFKRCRSSAIWLPPIERARQERVRKARKKIGKIKFLSKLQEILGFFDSLCSYLDARAKNGATAFLSVLHNK